MRRQGKKPLLVQLEDSQEGFGRHLRVVAKSAPLRFCPRQKLRTLPCSFFPQKIFDFFGPPMFGDWLLSSVYSSVSSSACHSAAEASLGIRQSPRGESAAEPTLGPSGRQLRLNC